MRKAADMLYLLAAFSIRTNLLDKAETYAAAGCRLFPGDLRMTELHAYARLQKGDAVGAGEVLATVDARSPNLEYLRARVAMTTGAAPEVQQRHLRAYLGGKT